MRLLLHGLHSKVYNELCSPFSQTQAFSEFAFITRPDLTGRKRLRTRVGNYTLLLRLLVAIPGSLYRLNMTKQYDINMTPYPHLATMPLGGRGASNTTLLNTKQLWGILPAQKATQFSPIKITTKYVIIARRNRFYSSVKLT